MDGLEDAVLAAIEAGEIEVYGRDTVQPSVFAHQLLNTMPYAFLDEAPLEERAGPRGTASPRSSGRQRPDRAGRGRHPAGVGRRPGLWCATRWSFTTRFLSWECCRFRLPWPVVERARGVAGGVVQRARR